MTSEIWRSKDANTRCARGGLCGRQSLQTDYKGAAWPAAAILNATLAVEERSCIRSLSGGNRTGA